MVYRIIQVIAAAIVERVRKRIEEIFSEAQAGFTVYTVVSAEMQ